MVANDQAITPTRGSYSLNFRAEKKNRLSR